ncbi:hypothetical protein LIS04_22 [Listeria phage LIS04]|nr:hypothetical protein LIS04_22 [Listeria phage LIS04]
MTTIFESNLVYQMTGVGYLVEITHDSIDNRTSTYIVIEDNTKVAYEVESRVAGYTVLESKFDCTENLIPIKHSIQIKLNENDSITTTAADTQDYRDQYGIESIDTLRSLTTEVREKYDGDYADVAVKIATIILSDTDSDGVLHGESDVTMSSGDIAKWALVSVINDVYEVCPEVVSDIHTPFVCMLYSGFLVMDSNKNILKYLPYSSSDEIDMLKILDKDTVEVILGDYPHQTNTDKELVNLAIKVAIDLFSKADELDSKYETDLIMYKDHQLIKDFLSLHADTLAEIDIGGFEKFLRSLRLSGVIEFWSPKDLDTRGLLESKSCYESVELFEVNYTPSGTLIKVKFTSGSPTNVSYNVLRSIYSSIVSS